EHRANFAIDVPAAPSRVQSGACEHRQITDVSREIALVGDANKLGRCAHGTHDLRCRREQRRHAKTHFARPLMSRDVPPYRRLSGRSAILTRSEIATYR